MLFTRFKWFVTRPTRLIRISIPKAVERQFLDWRQQQYDRFLDAIDDRLAQVHTSTDPLEKERLMRSVRGLRMMQDEMYTPEGIRSGKIKTYQNILAELEARDAADRFMTEAGLEDSWSRPALLAPPPETWVNPR